MIAINFASRDYRLRARITAALILTSVMFTLAAALLLWTGLSRRADIADLEKRTKDAAVRLEAMQSVVKERDRFVADLASMKELIEAKKFSWTRMFTNIEELFPTGVALDKIGYDPKSRALLLDGHAQSPEALRNLMVGLEKASFFSDPRLKNQAVEKGRISFNVTAFYKGPAGAGPTAALRPGQGK